MKQKNYCKGSCPVLLPIHYFLFWSRIESTFENPRRNGKPKPVSSFLIFAPWKMITRNLFVQHLMIWIHQRMKRTGFNFPLIFHEYTLLIWKMMWFLFEALEDKPSAALCFWRANRGGPWHSSVLLLQHLRRDNTQLGNAALIISYGKMCLHFQNSNVCISDYVATLWFLT